MADNYTEMVMAGHYEKHGDYSKAMLFYEKALKKSASAEIHERLGAISKIMGDLDSARLHFSEALRLEPQNIKCLYGMGVIERLSGNYEAAMENYGRLLEMGVDEAGVHMSMGVLHSELGELEKARNFYEAAFSRNPENNLVRFNYSLCLMTMGDFKRGLELYESRIWHAKPPGEVWRGESGTRLLVAPEQGNGDIIQFARYLPLLRGAEKVTVLCSAPLMRMIENVEGVDEVVEFNPGDEFVEVEKESEEEGLSAPLPFNKFTRIMSIPYIVGLDPSKEKFKRYLQTDESKRAAWSDKIRSEKLKVGLCWQGGKRDSPEMRAIDRRRSMRLEEMSPILSVKGVEFFSLQKNDEQHKEFVQIKDFMDESRDFSDTAAIIENLDLVISVDTAVAHLAAALEKPTWMLSRKGGCWRWGLEGEKTFWYPSMRIFRQERMSVWDAEIQKVADELRKFVQAKKSSDAPSRIS